MWDSIGEMLLVGIAILIIIAVPLQSIVIYTSKILRAKIALLTDTRVQLMSELVSGIQASINIPKKYIRISIQRFVIYLFH